MASRGLKTFFETSISSNSSFYSFRREISSVKEATTILGLGAIGAIALTSSVVDRMRIENKSGLFYRGLFWAHSIGSAVCSEVIAKETDYSRPDVAFTGAMVHDIGKLVLDRYFPDEFGRTLSEARKKQACFSEVESAVLPMPHAEVGYRLALKWGLSKDIAESILYHHSYRELNSFPEIQDKQLCAIVAAGNTMCGALAIGSSGNWKKTEVDHELMESAGLSPQQVSSLIDREHDLSARVQGFMQTVAS